MRALAVVAALMMTAPDAIAQVVEPSPPPVPRASAPAMPAPEALPAPDPGPETTPRPALGRVRPRPRPADESTPAPVDDQARPTSGAEAADGNPLPDAIAKPGSPPPPAGGPAETPDGYKPALERIPLGKQAAGLSVDVTAPAVMNVNQLGTIKILVRNTGVADAMAVRVNYELAKELTLVSADPPPKRIGPDHPELHWLLGTVAAGSEQLITLKVRPNAVHTVDHAALVTLMVGGRSRTVIQEPKLKVELTASPGKVLQGQQVRYNIAVTNPGSGPARNVLVVARLTPGLKLDGENLVEQDIQVIPAGGRVELPALVVDTFAGGEQTCTVLATSDDVATPSPEAKVARSVVVLRPELTIDLAGPETRFTDTVAEYRVTVDNPGTAAARDVQVAVTLPANNGRLQKPLPTGAKWDPSTNKLTYTIPNVEPKARTTARFAVLLGGIGSYRVGAEARSGPLIQTDSVLTDVSGIAFVEMEVTERKRVLDVEETTIFDVRIKNSGTKSAKNLLLRMKLSANVQAEQFNGFDLDKELKSDSNGDLIFPVIPEVRPGKEAWVSLQVLAKKPGMASCRVFLLHDDITDPTASLEDIAHTKVTAVSEGTNLK